MRELFNDAEAYMSYCNSPKIAVVIPARLNSSRFPQKILAEIQGKPMIINVLENAKKANVGDCFVACCCRSIKDLIESYGGAAFVTSPDLDSGTDRVFSAVEQMSEKPDIVVNLQGDTPVFEPTILKSLVDVLLANDKIDMSTPVVKITDQEDISNPNIVKVAFNNMERNSHGQAIYFSRSSVPNGAREHYSHIGMYAYRYESLKKFVNLSPSYLEITERLEQLRCLQNNMHVEAVPVNGYAIAVDVPEDIDKVNAFLNNSGLK